MSYVASNFYRNPGPYYDGPAFDAPVPGWGLLPNIAGAARVGVGFTDYFNPDNAPPPPPPPPHKDKPPALKIPLDPARLPQSVQTGDGGSGVPTWAYWLAGGVAVGAGVAYGRKAGWF